jgi:5'-methylthioadenosine nucleosidase
MCVCAAAAAACAGNSLDYTDKDMEIMTNHKAAVKEMEAAAIAWVAQLFKKPMFCIKAVTDIVDGDKPTQEEFLENLHAAAAALQQVLPKVLAFVSGKTLREL